MGDSFDSQLRTLKQSCGLPRKNMRVDLVLTETEVFKKIIEIVRWIDPDILVGYEIQKSSLGYLIERALALKPNPIDMLQELSRVPSEKASRKSEFDDGWSENNQSGIFITGRIVLNIWRIMKEELKLKVRHTNVGKEKIY